jgi:hypothetical protein
MLEELDWSPIALKMAGGENGATVVGMKGSLPFYRDVLLIRVIEGAGKTLPGYYLYYRDECFFLDGGPGAIYDANDFDGLRIDENNAIAYTLFFAQFLIAEHGKFYILRDETDISACGLAEKLPADAREKMVQPVVVGTDDERVRVRATAYYATFLANMTYEVRRDGFIQVVDAEPLWDEDLG